MTGLTLDAGALIAFDRGTREMVAIVRRARDQGHHFAVPAGVVGQVWRDGRKQSRLVHFLSLPTVEIEPLDDAGAREAGQLCGIRGTADVIDASVVLCAQRRGAVVITSDPEDMARLDPSLRVVSI